MSTEHQNYADTILQAGKQLERKASVLATDVGPMLVVPDGLKTTDLENLRPSPRALVQTVSVDTAASFVDYVKLFATEARQPVVFADLKATGASKLTAVIDYHADQASPSWNRHRVSMAFTFARHFEEWHGANKRAMSQAEFAQFLEDHIPQIGAPSGGTLHELILQFEAKKTVDFKSHQRLTDGSVQFTYNEDVQGTVQAGALKMPTEMTLVMPVFDGGVAQQFKARIRYRVEAGGKLVLWFELPDVKDVIEAEQHRITADVETALAGVTRGLILGRIG